MPIKLHLYRQKMISILLALDKKQRVLKVTKLEILISVFALINQKVREYNQEIKQSNTADQPTAP